MPVTLRGDHAARSKVEIKGRYIVLTQVFKEKEYYCSSAVAIGLSGNTFAEITNDLTVQLKKQMEQTHLLFLLPALLLLMLQKI